MCNFIAFKCDLNGRQNVRNYNFNNFAVIRNGIHDMQKNQNSKF